MFLHDFKSMKRAKYDWNGKIIVEFIGRTQRGGGQKVPHPFRLLVGGGVYHAQKRLKEKKILAKIKISVYTALGTKNVDYAIPCNFK